LIERFEWKGSLIMPIKIQAPEEKVNLPKIFVVLLLSSFLMVGISLYFLIKFLI